MATMPERYHRVIYRPLPDGETWVIAEIDGEPVIIVSEALDDAGRRRARREARASLHGRGLALAPLPVIATLGWLRERAHSPIGAALMASTMTMAGGYAVAEWTGDGPPAAPPVVVTLTSTLTGPITPEASRTRTPAPRTPAPRTTASPQPTRARTPAPTAITSRIAEPARTPEPTRPEPRRTTRPTRTPERTDDRPRESRTPEPADDAGEARSARPSTPPRTPGPPSGRPARTTPPPARDRPSAGPGGRDTPPAHGRDCGGIHVGVPPGVDLCLLG
jgi:hypothetical protein